MDVDCVITARWVCVEISLFDKGKLTQFCTRAVDLNLNLTRRYDVW